MPVPNSFPFQARHLLPAPNCRLLAFTLHFPSPSSPLSCFPPLPRIVTVFLFRPHLKVQKKKIWEEVQPDLKTDADLTANYKGRTMLTSAGPIKAPTLAGANIA